MSKARWVVAAAATGLAVLAAAVCLTSLGKNDGFIDPSADEGRITLGKTVYAANCAACHGVNLEGQASRAQGLYRRSGSCQGPPAESEDAWGRYIEFRPRTAAASPSGFQEDFRDLSCYSRAGDAFPIEARDVLSDAGGLPWPSAFKCVAKLSDSGQRLLLRRTLVCIGYGFDHDTSQEPLPDN